MPGIAITEIVAQYADAARTDEICRRLCRELGERGVPLLPLEAAPPPGAKSGAAAATGTITAVLASSSVTAAFVKGVFTWLAAREGRTISNG
ncbi:effector-associated constant component EACC1 [Actinomadura montaniterrae]|uniref:effector-associated constant component EACC1 n=1 Tax=Actinomadura montaniterrae TaxID=1803903 RepID=UPI001CEF76B1